MYIKDSLQLATERLIALEKQVDTIKSTKAFDELKYRALEHNDIINQVNEFYDKSWNSLLWLIGVLIGIFGLILPIISQLIAASSQRKSLKELTDTISKQLTEAFDQRLEQLTSANNLQFEKISNELKDQEMALNKKAEETRNAGEANAFVIQAQRAIDRENSFDAAYWYLAAFYTLNSVGIVNGRAKSSLQGFLNNFALLDENDLEERKEKLLHKVFGNNTFSSIMSQILEIDEPIYSDIINKLKVVLAEKKILLD